ncbi:hypothetical protein [Aneurinibacillus sp. UBA3580]|jgi:hypothetical protein|uniref:hypothetical protein n=1 Tax=Aneurinibacillus sp. UBA3580 TaxID=1946041 RepID=UPI00257B873D|nr:hypothetical protein [Aneurinibacillus sp. UBA3580]
MEKIFDDVIKKVKEYQEITDEQWKHDLEVDIDFIKTDTSIPDNLLKYFDSFPVLIKEIIKKYNGDKEIEEEVKSKNKQLIDFILTFVKLKEFLSFKSEQVKTNYFLTQHNEEKIEFIQTYNKNSHEFLFCLLTEVPSFNFLKDLFYSCIKHSFTYNEYDLAIDFEEIEDYVEREEAKERLNKGLKLDIPSISIIDKELKKFEEEEKSNYINKCKKITNSENEIVFYILRESKRDSIRKIDELLVDTSADWTVIRFSDSFKKLKIRSTFKKASNIANRILYIMGGDRSFFYSPSDRQTSPYYLARFLANVLGGKIKNLELLEMKINPLSIHGAPSVVIKKESEVPLRESIDTLRKQHNFKSVVDVNNIEHIKIRFTEGKAAHIFTLKISNVSGKRTKFIELGGKPGLLKKKERLIDMLSDYHVYLNEGRKI